MKKTAIAILLIAVLVFLFKTFHEPILQFFGSCLIHEDKLEPADAIVVLSGSAFERGNKGAELIEQGYAKKVLCPGGNIDHTYLILIGDSIYESDVTRKKILLNGIADSLVIAIHEGTSTIEEAIGIRSYCSKNNIRSLIVVSSYFHTARVNRVYKNVFSKSGIKIIIRGANSVYFDEKYWWKDEYGLLNFNNEVIKSVYYFFKN
jgi:uncharacterized SAM-binding protein YcdF (DUF218 family)